MHSVASMTKHTSIAPPHGDERPDEPEDAATAEQYRHPPAPIQEILHNEDYLESRSNVLCENEFTEYHASSIGWKPVHLGITMSKLIRASPVANNNNNNNNNNNKNGSYEILSVWPLKYLALSVHTETRRIGLRLPNKDAFFYELADKTQTNWEKWLDTLLYLGSRRRTRLKIVSVKNVDPEHPGRGKVRCKRRVHISRRIVTGEEELTTDIETTTENESTQSGNGDGDQLGRGEIGFDRSATDLSRIMKSMQRLDTCDDSSSVGPLLAVPPRGKPKPKPKPCGAPKPERTPLVGKANMASFDSDYGSRGDTCIGFSATRLCKTRAGESDELSDIADATDSELATKPAAAAADVATVDVHAIAHRYSGGDGPDTAIPHAPPSPLSANSDVKSRAIFHSASSGKAAASAIMTPEEENWDEVSTKSSQEAKLDSGLWSVLVRKSKYFMRMYPTTERVPEDRRRILLSHPLQLTYGLRLQ